MGLGIEIRDTDYGIPFLIFSGVAGLEQAVPRFKRKRKSQVKTVRGTVFKPPS